jgi:hypothetical protein
MDNHQPISEAPSARITSTSPPRMNSSNAWLLASPGSPSVCAVDLRIPCHARGLSSHPHTLTAAHAARPEATTCAACSATRGTCITAKQCTVHKCLSCTANGTSFQRNPQALSTHRAAVQQAAPAPRMHLPAELPSCVLRRVRQQLSHIRACKCSWLARGHDAPRLMYMCSHSNTRHSQPPRPQTPQAYR